MNYPEFLNKFDEQIKKYFDMQNQYIHCKAGCSLCCEQGDYPMTAIELEFLMQGFIELDDNKKKHVQDNFKNMEKGGACPFLVNHLCSVYKNRPIVCRTHGLAYIYKEGKVKIPYCANNGKNFSEIDTKGEIDVVLIKENLDTPNILTGYEIRNLYDWIKV